MYSKLHNATGHYAVWTTL